jgi:hypothetical protein
MIVIQITARNRHRRSQCNLHLSSLNPALNAGHFLSLPHLTCHLNHFSGPWFPLLLCELSPIAPMNKRKTFLHSLIPALKFLMLLVRGEALTLSLGSLSSGRHLPCYSLLPPDPAPLLLFPVARASVPLTPRQCWPRRAPHRTIRDHVLDESSATAQTPARLFP